MSNDALANVPDKPLFKTINCDIMTAAREMFYPVNKAAAKQLFEMIRVTKPHRPLIKHDRSDYESGPVYAVISPQMMIDAGFLDANPVTAVADEANVPYSVVKVTVHTPPAGSVGTDLKLVPFNGTFVMENLPDNPQYHPAELAAYKIVGPPPSDRIALTQWDFSSIPSTAVIDSAQLNLFAWNQFGTGTIDIHRMTAQANLDRCTWNNRDYVFPYVPWTGYGPLSDAVFYNSTPAPGLWMNFFQIDITSLVQGWIDGTFPNYGLAIAATGNIQNRYRSNWYSVAAEHPFIKIRFTETPQRSGNAPITIRCYTAEWDALTTPDPTSPSTNIGSWDTQNITLMVRDSFIKGSGQIFMLVTKVAAARAQAQIGGFGFKPDYGSTLGQTLLMLTGDGTTNYGQDAALYARLVALGFTVTVAQKHISLTTSYLQGFAMIFMTSSAQNYSAWPSALTTIDRPIFTMDPRSLDNLGLSAGGYSWQSGKTTTMKGVDHPITANAAQPVPIYSSPYHWFAGVPSGLMGHSPELILDNCEPPVPAGDVWLEWASLPYDRVASRAPAFRLYCGITTGHTLGENPPLTADAWSIIERSALYTYGFGPGVMQGLVGALIDAPPGTGITIELLTPTHPEWAGATGLSEASGGVSPIEVDMPTTYIRGTLSRRR